MVKDRHALNVLNTQLNYMDINQDINLALLHVQSTHLGTGLSSPATMLIHGSMQDIQIKRALSVQTMRTCSMKPE